MFDSGVGGLTVARALMDLLPDERLVYFGDTARGPYGPRDLDEVRRFTAEIVAYLAAQDTKLVVAACNTATAAALSPAPEALRDLPVPVLGVIAPAVAAAVKATRNGRIGVIGTVGTIASGSYDAAITGAAPEVKLFSQACPRFVDLVELGRVTDAEVLDIAREYLAPLVAAGVDTVILGCTHYPLLTGVLSYTLGPEVVLVSSAEATARAVFGHLVDGGLLADGGVPGGSQPAGGPREAHRFVVSGDGHAFSTMAARFLGPRLADQDVSVQPLGRPAR